MPSRACLPRKRGKQGTLGEQRRRTDAQGVAEARGGAGAGAIHHRGSSNICDSICLFVHVALAILIPRMKASAYDPPTFLA
eukprot:9492150-Pyramimonas_sp.AAC.2